jgi:hypothetical protein
MSFWIPVAFICFVNGSCGFANGTLTVTARQCEQKNYAVRQKLAADINVGAFELTCVQIPKEEFI